MANIIDSFNVDLEDGIPRTYYLRIDIICISTGDIGATFFKFGVSSNKISHRFKKEGRDVRITILNVWPHETLEEAYEHEQKLFRKFKPAKLFLGWPDCPRDIGPLAKANGNTELFISDCVNGTIQAQLPTAKMIVEKSPVNSYSYDRSYITSRSSIFTLPEVTKWEAWLTYIPRDFCLLPKESYAKQHLVFIRSRLLTENYEFYGQRATLEAWRKQAVPLSSFEEAEDVAGILYSRRI